MNDSIFVRMADMPCTIKSYVVSNSDLTFTIVINSRQCHEQQVRAYQQELAHILNGDYDKKCSADIIELSMHQR